MIDEQQPDGELGRLREGCGRLDVRGRDKPSQYMRVLVTYWENATDSEQKSHPTIINKRLGKGRDSLECYEKVHETMIQHPRALPRPSVERIMSPRLGRQGCAGYC